MGREAYLDKIAFGRSAFTPTHSATQSSDYVQLESAQAEIPRRYLEASANNYVQLYDEHGHAINPRAREYAKKLRRAQNDVLASVGVVERQPPHAGLSGSEERLDRLDAEDTAGNAIAITTTLSENLCTWWIGSIRARLMAFCYPAVSLSQIISNEWAPSLLYAGFPARFCSILTVQAVACSAIVYQPLTRVLLATRASTRTRQFFRRWQGALRIGFRCAVELAVYPLSYHARLQRLGLVPASVLLPAWRSLVPWSASSPLTPLSARYDASASVADCMMALVTSPVVLVCVEHFIERWVYACIHEAVEASVLRPENADRPRRAYADKEWGAALLGRRGQSPPMLRRAINRVLVSLGWGRPLKKEGAGSVRVGGTHVANIRSLETPAMGNNTANGTTEADAGPGPSPDVFAEDSSDNDPRIRITSREGTVEMEVRLPSRVVSSHTEVVESGSPDAEPGTVPDEGRRMTRSHHVTQLSLEPGLMVGAIVKAQLVSLALVPLQTISCGLIAEHFGTHRPLRGVGGVHGSEVGTHLSRLALCAALEVGMDLGLWGVQYFAVTRLGQDMFEWGRL